MQRTAIILDGGMSRELVAHGAELRQPEWSAGALIETPAIVETAHKAFIEAGADVVTTNSYALVPFHIGEERFRADGLRLAELSGCLARNAAAAFPERGVRVAGSLPPLFGSYEPEKFRPDEAPALLAVLIEGLSPHVDLWLGETLSLIAEGEAVCAALDGDARPIWISFTLDDEAVTAGEPRLRSGESVTAAAEWIAGSRAEALLFNCSKPEIMADAVAAARRVFDAARPGMAIGVYANAFEASEEDGAANETLHALRDDLGPERYARMASQWIEAGASMVGGCCGIGHDHIACLRATLR